MVEVSISVRVQAKATSMPLKIHEVGAVCWFAELPWEEFCIPMKNILTPTSWSGTALKAATIQYWVTAKRFEARSVR
eukprot:symbB.v1.2.024987.t1/scaffold2394.1/size82379/3